MDAPHHPSREVLLMLRDIDNSASCASYRMGFAAVRLNWTAQTIAARLEWIEKYHPPKVVIEFTKGMIAAQRKEA